jgi:hypothetical protein
MALKLYKLTPDQDEYQRTGFGIVLLVVSFLCVLLGLGSIVVGTPCLRSRFESKQKVLAGGKRKEQRKKPIVISTSSKGAVKNPLYKPNIHKNLLMAVANEQFDAVKYLLRPEQKETTKGLQEDKLDDQNRQKEVIEDSQKDMLSGQTALHYLARWTTTNISTLKLLLSNTSSSKFINAADYAGNNPLDLAYNNKHSPVQMEIIDLLRYHGALANFHHDFTFEVGPLGLLFSYRYDKIVVEKIAKGSKAENFPQICEGDILVSVNKQMVTNQMILEAVLQLIRTSGYPLTLTFEHGGQGE